MREVQLGDDPRISTIESDKGSSLHANVMTIGSNMGHVRMPPLNMPRR
jgi:hypothetical protein